MAKLVTVQQAAANAVTAYLANAVNNPTVYPPPDEQVKFEPRWPDASKSLPHRAVTLIPAGGRTDAGIEVLGWSNDPTAVSPQPPNLPTGVVIFRWPVAWYEQPVQLDVWALTWNDRDDVLARLDVALAEGAGQSPVRSSKSYPTGDPVASFLALPLAQSDGWQGAFCGAYFTDDGPQLLDTALTAQRTMFRATWRGTLDILLTVDAPSYKMATIKFQQQRLAQGASFPGTFAPDLELDVTTSGAKIVTP